MSKYINFIDEKHEKLNTQKRKQFGKDRYLTNFIEICEEKWSKHENIFQQFGNAMLASI